MRSPRFHKQNLLNNYDVVQVWNSLAQSRYEDIYSGRDRSYEQVLMPLVEEFAAASSGGRVLDAGCGVGFVSAMLSRYFSEVDAVDPSDVSIQIAKEENNRDNIRYKTGFLEGLALSDSRYDVIVSSMVLMDCLDIQAYISSCQLVLKPGGKIFITICHPFFWPRYWGFEKMSWFAYNDEISIRSKFRTSSAGVSHLDTLYFHRPLAAYVECLRASGFNDVKIREISGLSVSSKTQNRYPRYVAIEAVRNN